MIGEQRVLNPQLYAMLQQHFGKVRVQNRGRPFKYKRTTTGLRGMGSSEEYLVCCPLCGDKRFRLSVNHRFGTHVGSSRILYAKCWNEGCRVVPLLERMLQGIEMAVQQPVIESPQEDHEAIAFRCLNEYMKLNNLIRFDRLAVDHPAVSYMRSRGFNQQQLANWNVHVCLSGHKLAARRIIFPVLHRFDNKLDVIGWQARAVPGWSSTMKPKYFTSPGYVKSEFLYNYTAACAHDILVIVEGALDAIRVGPQAVALFGDTISDSQLRLLYDGWAGKRGPVVLFGDPGFVEEWQRIAQQVTEIFSLDGGKKRVHLFIFDTDPGSTDTEVLWRAIRHAGKQCGYVDQSAGSQHTPV